MDQTNQNEDIQMTHQLLDIDLLDLLSSDAPFDTGSLINDISPPMSTSSLLEQSQPNSDDEVVSSKLVYISFGNKRVQKGSNEYKVMRVKSADAVRKCRQKKKEAEKERIKNLETLMDEKQRLLDKIRKLEEFIEKQSIEIGILKDIIKK